MESHSIISENQGYDSTRIIFLTSCTLIATYVLKTVLNRRNVQKQLPPCIPHTIPFLGHAISFGESPIEFLVAAYHKYGSVFSFTMVGKTFTYLVGPDMSAPFFDSKNDELNAEEVYEKLVTPVFGKGVAYDVPNHVFLQQKKIFKTGLNVGRFKLHVPVIEEETEAYFSRWGEAGEKDIFKSMSELIILTASSCLHGKEIRSGMTEEVAQLYMDLDGGFSAEAWLLPSWLPLPSFKKRDLALKKLKTIFYSAINKRRNSEEREDDMLQTLLEATYKDGRALNDEEVSGMLIGLLMAGQHTSSSTSSWIGFYLAKHPHIQDAVYKEIEKCCGEHGPLDYDSLNDCELLNRCLKETLRLRPPVMTMMRMCKVPLKVGNYVIPPGHQVCVSPTATQRLPSVWQHWDQFIPDRFLDKSTSSEDRFSYIPFGAGRHRCIGESFAYVQIKTIWATLLRMYHFELVDGYFPEVNYTTMIHSPKNPVIRYRKRSTHLDTQ